MPWMSDESGERLYPGTVELALAAAGAAVLVAGPVAGRRRRRRPVAFLGTGVVLAGLLSLGLRLSIFGREPYRLVRQWVPGFQDLRSPFRAAVLVQVLLLPLAGVALDALWRCFNAPGESGSRESSESSESGAEVPEPVAVGVGGGGSGGVTGPVEPVLPPGPGAPGGDPGPVAGEPAAPREDRWWQPLGPLTCALVVAVGLAETWPVYQAMVEVPTTGHGTDWVDFLADHQETGAGDGSVAMIPFPDSGNYIAYEPTTVWMLAALDHGHPLVNGYSGLFPAAHDTLESAMRRGFPTDETTRLLAGAHVSWVVAPRSWAEGDGRDGLTAFAADYRPAFTGQETVVYSFTPPLSGPSESDQPAGP
jgi:hypothetical protein